MLVPMELTRIIVNETTDQYVIYLKEADGDRMLPILIGVFEATSINRRLLDDPFPRPMTHELLRRTIDELGGQTQDVVITDLQDHTYYAVIRIKMDSALIEVDSRPSDAIALAVQYQPVLPIFVEDTVLDSAL